MTDEISDMIKRNIRIVHDFPTKGVNFLDLTTIWMDPELMKLTAKNIADVYRGRNVDKVVGIEARGFITGSQVAYELGAGFVLARKAGKLPGEKISETFSLEYGTATLEMHRDSIKEGERVLIVDDTLATGGTASAATRIIGELKGDIVGVAFVAELEYMHGREDLNGYDVYSVARYASKDEIR